MRVYRKGHRWVASMDDGRYVSVGWSDKVYRSGGRIRTGFSVNYVNKRRLNSAKARGFRWDPMPATIFVQFVGNLNQLASDVFDGKRTFLDEDMKLPFATILFKRGHVI